MDGTFLRKTESRGNKIARVNWIRITESINLLEFCTGVGVIRCDVDIFKPIARALSIYWDFSAWIHRIIIGKEYG